MYLCAPGRGRLAMVRTAGSLGHASVCIRGHSTLSRLVASCHICSCSLCGVPFMPGPGVLEGEGGAAAGPGPNNHGGWPGRAHVRYGAIPPSSVPSNAHAPRVPQWHAPGPHWARHPAARVPRTLRHPWRQWVSSAREYLGLCISLVVCVLPLLKPLGCLGERNGFENPTLPAP